MDGIQVMLTCDTERAEFRLIFDCDYGEVDVQLAWALRGYGVRNDRLHEELRARLALPRTTLKVDRWELTLSSTPGSEPELIVEWKFGGTHARVQASASSGKEVVAAAVEGLTSRLRPEVAAELLDDYRRRAAAGELSGPPEAGRVRGKYDIVVGREPVPVDLQIERDEASRAKTNGF